MWCTYRFPVRNSRRSQSSCSLCHHYYYYYIGVVSWNVIKATSVATLCTGGYSNTRLCIYNMCITILWAFLLDIVRVPFIYWKYGRWYQYLLLYDVDVQSLRTTSNLRIYSSEESTCGEYSSRCGEKRSAGKLEFFSRCTVWSACFLFGTLVVWHGSWFITIGTIEPCIERCWGVLGSCKKRYRESWRAPVEYTCP